MVKIRQNHPKFFGIFSLLICLLLNIYEINIFEACHFYAGLGGTCTLVTINTMTAIGIDRYLVLAKFKRGHWHKNKNILIVLFVAWTPAILWNSAPVFGWGGFMLEGYGTTCTYDYLSQKISNKTYLSAMLLTEFMLPVTIIALVYRSIYISVKNNEKVLGKSSDKLQRKVKAGQKYKRRLSEVKIGKTAALAFSVFFVSWIPNICITLLGLFNNRKAITPLSSTVAGLVAKSWSVYSPFIYTMNLPAFRKSLINTIIVKRCHFKIAWLKSYCKLKSHPCCTVYRSNKSNAYKMSTFEAQNNDHGHIIVSMFPVCPNCKQKLHLRSVTWQKVHNPKP